MIFFTVGTQLPFNRLLKLVDIAAGLLPEEQFFAQIADSDYLPKNMQWKRTIDEKEYHSILSRSKLIIGHAGMGTILNALDYSIPLIMSPREYSLGEHRNDHQLATAKRFGDIQNIAVFKKDEDLRSLIIRVLDKKTITIYKNFKLDQFCYNLNKVIQ